MSEFTDAIRTGETARISAMLEADPSLANARDDTGVPALAIARYNQRTEIVDLLLSRGARLDIWMAAMFGNMDVLKTELERDPASIHAKSADGWTPLHLAAFFNQADAALALIEAGADVNARSTNQMANTALHAAAAGGANDVARLLIERGASANARQHGGWTPLHSAAQSGNAELARLLIGAGADLRARADNQQSPMDLALTRGHQEIAELLDEFGADQ